ncbi:MAG TPA: glycosyltransferase [Allosphingosinicella sp.]|nr:glycosyltransferase [Allosphingosinicella sp.]
MTNPHVEIADHERLPTAPRVSIVVMTYNHEPYLREAVESLARQVTSFEYEILIGEDASHDRTRDVALGLQAEFPHLVRLFLSERNRGMTGNFRFLIDLCRGEYFAGCEGDDFWIDDHKLERQVHALDRVRTVDMAFTRGYRLYGDGTRVAGWNYGDQPRVVSSREMFRGLGYIAPAASSMMRGELVRSLPDWIDDAPVGDVFHYLAATARGGAWYEPNLTVCYRMAQPTSFSVAHENRTDEELIAFFKSAIDYVERTCRHYRVPRRVMAERLNEYQLQIAWRRFNQRKMLSGLWELARVDADFLARGAGRRLSRLIGLGGRAEPDHGRG